jgi:hypothetical protein
MTVRMKIRTGLLVLGSAVVRIAVGLDERLFGLVGGSGSASGTVG